MSESEFKKSNICEMISETAAHDESKHQSKVVVNRCGDVVDLMDKTIGRPVMRIRGSVSANNYVEFENLHLTGHVIHIQLNVSKSSVATLHIELITSASTPMRISISSLYQGDQPKYPGRNLGTVRLPMPIVDGWQVLVIDLNEILNKYCTQRPENPVSLQCVKKIQLCSNMSLRDVVTGNQRYSSDVKDLSVKLGATVHWVNLTDCLSHSPIAVAHDGGPRSLKGSDHLQHLLKPVSPDPTIASSSLADMSSTPAAANVAQNDILTEEAGPAAKKSTSRIKKARAAKSPKTASAKPAKAENIKPAPDSAAAAAAPEAAAAKARSLSADRDNIENANYNEFYGLTENSQHIVNHYASLSKPAAMTASDLASTDKKKAAKSLMKVSSPKPAGGDETRHTVLTKALTTPRHQLAGGERVETGSTVKYEIPETSPWDRLLLLQRMLGYHGGPAVLLYEDGRMLLTAAGPMLVLIDLDKQLPTPKHGFWKAFHCAPPETKGGFKQAIIRGHSSAVGLLEVSEKETYLLTGETGVQNGLLILWDLVEGKRLATLKPHTESITCAGFNADCTMLVTAGTDSQHRHQIIVWDMQLVIMEKGVVSGTNVGVSGLAIAKQISEFHFHHIRFSPFEEYSLVSCGKENIRFWRIRKGHLPGRPVVLNSYARGYEFQQVAFYTDASLPLKDPKKHLIYVSSNKGLLLRVSPLNDQVLCAFQLYSGCIRTLCISGNYAATGGDHGAGDYRLRIWPMNFGDFLLESQNDGPITNMRFSEDGKKLAIGTTSGTLGILNAVEMSFSTVLRSHIGRVSHIAKRNEDGFEFATIGVDRTIRIWETQTANQIVEFSADEDTATCVAYHPDDYILACGFSSGCVRIFDISSITPSHEKKSHEGAVSSIIYFKSAGLLTFMASGGVDGNVVIYSLAENYEPIKIIQVLIQLPCRSIHIAVSDEGSLMALVADTVATLMVLDTVDFSLHYRTTQQAAVAVGNGGAASSPAPVGVKITPPRNESPAPAGDQSLTAPVVGICFAAPYEARSGSARNLPSLLIVTEKHIVNLPMNALRESNNSRMIAKKLSLWEERVSCRIEFGIPTMVRRDAETGLLFVAVRAPLSALKRKNKIIAGAQTMSGTLGATAVTLDQSPQDRSFAKNKLFASTINSTAPVLTVPPSKEVLGKNKVSDVASSFIVLSLRNRSARRNRLAVTSIQLYQDLPGELCDICPCLPCGKVITADSSGCISVWNINSDNLQKILKSDEDVATVSSPEEEEEEDEVTHAPPAASLSDLFRHESLSKTIPITPMTRDFELAVKEDPSLWSAATVSSPQHLKGAGLVSPVRSLPLHDEGRDSVLSPAPESEPVAAKPVVTTVPVPKSFESMYEWEEVAEGPGRSVEKKKAPPSTPEKVEHEKEESSAALLHAMEPAAASKAASEPMKRKESKLIAGKKVVASGKAKKKTKATTSHPGTAEVPKPVDEWVRMQADIEQERMILQQSADKLKKIQQHTVELLANSSFTAEDEVGDVELIAPREYQQADAKNSTCIVAHQNAVAPCFVHPGKLLTSDGHTVVVKSVRDGKQHLLPTPPAAKGHQGWRVVDASLSPDGTAAMAIVKGHVATDSHQKLYLALWREFEEIGEGGDTAASWNSVMFESLRSPSDDLDFRGATMSTWTQGSDLVIAHLSDETTVTQSWSKYNMQLAHNLLHLVTFSSAAFLSSELSMSSAAFSALPLHVSSLTGLRSLTSSERPDDVVLVVAGGSKITFVDAATASVLWIQDTGKTDQVVAVDSCICHNHAIQTQANNHLVAGLNNRGAVEFTVVDLNKRLFRSNNVKIAASNVTGALEGLRLSQCSVSGTFMAVSSRQHVRLYSVYVKEVNAKAIHMQLNLLYKVPLHTPPHFLSFIDNPPEITSKMVPKLLVANPNGFIGFIPSQAKGKNALDVHCECLTVQSAADAKNMSEHASVVHPHGVEVLVVLSKGQLQLVHSMSGIQDVTVGTTLAAAPTAPLFAVGGKCGKLVIYDAATMGPKATISAAPAHHKHGEKPSTDSTSDHPQLAVHHHSGSVECIKFSNNSRWLLSVMFSGDIYMAQISIPFSTAWKVNERVDYVKLQHNYVTAQKSARITMCDGDASLFGFVRQHSNVLEICQHVDSQHGVSPWVNLLNLSLSFLGSDDADDVHVEVMAVHLLRRDQILVLFMLGRSTESGEFSIYSASLRLPEGVNFSTSVEIHVKQRVTVGQHCNSVDQCFARHLGVVATAHTIYVLDLLMVNNYTHVQLEPHLSEDSICRRVIRGVDLGFCGEEHLWKGAAFAVMEQPEGLGDVSREGEEKEECADPIEWEDTCSDGNALILVAVSKVSGSTLKFRL